MRKIHLLVLVAIFFFSTESNAQEITPTNLIQLFKFWRMDSKDFARNTNDCLQLIDKKWLVPQPPDTTNNNFSIAWLYFAKPNEIQLEYGLIGGVYQSKVGLAPSKVLVYNFKGKRLWNEYKKQMEQLGAVNYNTAKSGDGIGHFYAATSLKFILTENPPGINSKEVTYGITITTL